MLKRPEWLGRSFNVRQAGRKNCLSTYSNLHNNGQSNPWKEWLRQSCMVWNCFGGTLLGYMCCTELQIRLMVGYMYVHTKSCIFIVRSTVMVHLAGVCAFLCIIYIIGPLPKPLHHCLPFESWIHPSLADGCLCAYEQMSVWLDVSACVYSSMSVCYMYVHKICPVKYSDMHVCVHYYMSVRSQ